ncbi:DUF6531 domain-containing protein [Pseudomonas capsici]|uniref:DUF6531 domain-containing protein n=1 Tax=Pseudomonas capsici TaxID=2810614 RepID=A0ABT3BYL5_9PSED|nr:DUF6531 domain-containing protein [Pseudomonas capsici]MBX8473475.1 RHS repeat protein [Pseudomonas cichorii]MCV4268727.1 DUF6531 domain-containing protein [Pseudomonas capsici]MCV4278937.1 DUF6531 domain-containing protein [Pseudomonas capsici]MCV4332519.1 DUF6531 domain-containing protein [Pseudomonas capsici]MCV4377943.1 DUF6531 domain-containing protein [Pseudomonas capsici]
MLWGRRFFVCLCCFFSGCSIAEIQDVISEMGPWRWIHHYDNFDNDTDAEKACNAVISKLGYINPGYDRCSRSVWAPPYNWYAGYLNVGHDFHFIEFYVRQCSEGKMYNVATARCGNDEQKGAPPPESCVGNPISLAVGNKFQVELDYKAHGVGAPVFTRAYNSLDGIWRHNYSTFIRFAIGKLSLVHADGRESFFSVEGDIATAYPTETGLLVKTGSNWLYTADNNARFTFDASGRLIEWVDAAGLRQQLTYANDQVTVTSDSGQSLTFTEDTQHQPLSLVAPGLQINYSYDNNKHLVQLNRTRGSQTEQRQFHYEDSRNTGLLTGITDERGVRFATWSYDDQGRAVSSQHSGGAGLTQVAYNTDGSRTVTNELGKTTIYRYQQIGGIKRVASIEGEPSPNCPASNSSYTYNERAQVLTKTDAKGLVTTYSYNSRGLQTSRTEATGTTESRTVMTEWDPERFLPTKIVEPNRVTVYSYDNQGRELTRQVTPR